MEVLVIGLGSIGLRHANNLKTLGVDSIIGIDPNEKMRLKFQNEIGGLAIHSFNELPVNTKPKLSVICSPSSLHIEQAMFCAKLGSNLFIEKPISTNLDQIEELQKIVLEKNLYAHIGSNFKFHPALMKIKECLEQEEIGKVVSAQILAGQWLPDWHPTEDYRRGYSAKSNLGGGIVLDSHEMDYITWLLGPVKDIVGFCTNSGALEIDTEDIAIACIQFETGALCSMQVDYIQRHYKKRYNISGDLGTIDWDFLEDSLKIYSSQSKEVELYNYPSEDINDMYIRQMKHVLDGVTKNVSPITPIRHASEALELQLRIKSHYV